jgi:hypothetical protein
MRVLRRTPVSPWRWRMRDNLDSLLLDGFCLAEAGVTDH